MFLLWRDRNPKEMLAENLWLYIPGSRCHHFKTMVKLLLEDDIPPYEKTNGGFLQPNFQAL